MNDLSCRKTTRQSTVEHLLEYFKKRNFVYGDIKINVVDTSDNCIVTYKEERYSCFECNVIIKCENTNHKSCLIQQQFYRFLEVYKPVCIQDKINVPLILVETDGNVEEAISGVVLDDE